MEMPALALTDHGSMHGVIPFYQKARAAGIKPIIGCEVYVAPRTRSDKQGKIDQAFHLVLLAKDIRGYRHLLQLTSRAHLEGFYYRPRVDKELLRHYSQGLIALTSCLKGEIPHLLLEGKMELAQQVAQEYLAIFGEGNFYLEVQNHKMEEERVFQKEMVELSRRMGIPIVATNDSHYTNRDDFRTHEILLCVGTGKSLEDADRLSFENEEFYFKNEEEMREAFAHLPEALDNTLEIAQQCNLELDFGHFHLPNFIVPEDHNVDSFLRLKAEEGLKQRYHDCALEQRERLHYELETIGQMGFSAYFLVVWDLVHHAHDRGIAVGPGRGSVCGSLVAYALGITEIDPLRYNLFFERFLNPERITMPDFDIDFCSKRRDEVIQYLMERYGQENVAQIATFGTMAARAAVRDCGRVLKVPLWQVDRVAKMIPFGSSISEALATVSELHSLYDSNPQIKELLDSAKGLEGISRHASTHAAGVVISAEPLMNYVPLMLGTDGVVTTQFAKDEIEKIGLLKMDILGLSTLTMMRVALALIKERRGEEINWSEVSLSDERTFSLLQQADTAGVFQLESSGMRQILKNLRPTCIEDIIAIVALFRPGPMQMIDDFIKRKSGAFPIQYFHPELEPILKETYGTIVYQEQVMQISSTLAGYSLGEADLLRRAMAKKDKAIMDTQRPAFIKRAVERGIARETAGKIFDFMAEFARYGFNKSHATAYAVLAYHTAYLKAHYPLEFSAALLSSVMGDEKKVRTYVEECNRFGMKVLSPNLNEGGVGFLPGGDNQIYFGLAAVKNVGQGAVEVILEERERGGFFSSLSDFLARVSSHLVNRKTVESLIKAGAFDFTGKGRAELLYGLDVLLGQAKRLNHRDQAALFSTDELSPVEEVSWEGGEYSDAEVLAMEKEVLGFYISNHPLARYQEVLAGYNLTPLGSLAELEEGKELTVGGMIQKTKVIPTKNGGQMLFLTLEDLSSSQEVTIFPRLYKDVSPFLTKEGVLIVHGKISQGEDSVKILADKVVTFLEREALENRRRIKEEKEVYLNLTLPSKADLDTLIKLKDVLEQYPGRCPVTLYVSLNGKKVVLSPSTRFWVRSDARLLARLRELLGKDNVWISDN